MKRKTDNQAQDGTNSEEPGHGFFKISGEKDIEVERKTVLLNSIILLSFILIPLYIVFTYIKGDYRQFIFELAALVLTVIVFIYFRRTGDLHYTALFINSVIGLFLLFLVGASGPESGGAIGSMAFPLLAMFLLGTKRGVAAATVYLVIICAMFFFPGTPLLIYEYSGDFKLIFIASFIAVSLLAFFTEWIRAVTQEKIAEKKLALENTLEELKHTEDERSLLQDELLSAKKLEAIGTLAGGMAHEFNNQISVVLGNTDLLLHLLETNEVTEKKLKAIQKASDRIAVLTDQLLSFSRKQILKLERTNINKLIHRTEYSIKNQLGKNFELILELEETPDDIEVDPGQIIQVILDLTMNASDALNEKGSGTLTVKTENVTLSQNKHSNSQDSQSGRFICLTVTDTGTGMPEDTLQRVFEPFFTTKNPGQGIGLGMSFVYGTVKQHNGWTEIDSSPGKGACVKVWFPAMDPLPT